MITAVIVAAGNSTRFHKNKSKLFMKINDKFIINIIIDKFLSIKAISNVILVINEKPEFKQIINQYNDRVTFVKGGKKRQDSVLAALNLITTLDNSKVLIHDAARFNCSIDLINKVIDASRNHPAVIPILNIVDTVKQLNTENQTIKNTLNRDMLGLAQTPQAFDLELIKELHQTSQDNITDDAQLCEYKNINIKYINGEKNNFKITQYEDYLMAKKLHDDHQYIYATGYDLHRFDKQAPNSKILLGGIEIQSEKPLIAHSDGDVLLHSLTDAVLGAAASLDIGELFPDNKIENKNRPSIDFIEKAISIAKQKNIVITHIDATIILEKPKISDFKIKIRNNIAKIFNIDIESVNIKATTNEKIGDIGKGDAIAALTIITAQKYGKRN